MSRRATSIAPGRRQQGMALLWLMFALFFMAIAIGSAIDNWSTAAQRAREQQLLWTGDQYRKAIRSYYELSPGGNKQYPQKLDDLLEDKRYVTLQRHLRKLYPDPMTDKPDWSVLTDPNGRVIGVASQSERAPIKIGKFAASDQDFRDKQHYNEWKFVYQPSAAATGSTPGTQPGTPPITPPAGGKQ